MQTKRRTTLSSSRDAIDLRVSRLYDVLQPPDGCSRSILFSQANRHLFSFSHTSAQPHNVVSSPFLTPPPPPPPPPPKANQNENMAAASQVLVMARLKFFSPSRYTYKTLRRKITTHCVEKLILLAD